MCGIVGFGSTEPLPEDGLLVASRDALRHRGPDDAGLWRSPDGRVAFGHRRLAVIDLSPSGHQPMSDASGQLWLTYNGEIYNYLELKEELEKKGYAFHTASDTEVILAAYQAWGTDCLVHLNGMFAFGLYDAANRRLFLARDRAGEKPLFYRRMNDTLAFASELKALMVDPNFPRRLNLEALDCYLHFGYVPGDMCILQGVNKLPPAHALSFDLANNQLRVWRYWQLPHPPEVKIGANRGEEQRLVEEFASLLQDATRRQLISDVPLGILLSGGVDSSLITALAAKIQPKVKTFTIRFPGHGQHDETEHARLIAQHFGTEHHELVAEASTLDLLHLLAKQFDEPIVDSSMIPTYLVCKLMRHYCTVALGGDGGDELFAGYPHYSRLLWQEGPLSLLPQCLRSTFSTLSSRVLPLGFKGRNWLKAVGIDFEHGLPLIADFFDLQSRRALVKKELHTKSLATYKAEAHWRQRVPDCPLLLDRACRMDYENYLPEDILVKVDRASMLNSLEVRAPMLDYRLIEFAFGKVPSALKASKSERKILPKLLARRLLPANFDFKRKQGFTIPMAAWIKGDYGDFFRQVLLESEDDIFNRKFIIELFQGQEKGRANSERLFALVLFTLWRQEYRVAV
jgi:asparagine synthase (glutamine-hydrolysing)